MFELSSLRVPEPVKYSNCWLLELDFKVNVPSPIVTLLSVSLTKLIAPVRICSPVPTFNSCNPPDPLSAMSPVNVKELDVVPSPLTLRVRILSLPPVMLELPVSPLRIVSLLLAVISKCYQIQTLNLGQGHQENLNCEATFPNLHSHQARSNLSS